MTTPAAPQAVAGWNRPEWATCVAYDQDAVVFEVVAKTIPVGTYGNEPIGPRQIELVRSDTVRVDGEDGTLTVTHGEPYVRVAVEDVTVTEARRLHAALGELLALVDGESQA